MVKRKRRMTEPETRQAWVIEYRAPDPDGWVSYAAKPTEKEARAYLRHVGGKEYGFRLRRYLPADRT